MIFTKDSGLVKTFVFLIDKKLRKREDVPDISNLRETVYAVLDKKLQKS